MDFALRSDDALRVNATVAPHINSARSRRRHRDRRASEVGLARTEAEELSRGGSGSGDNCRSGHRRKKK